MRFAPRAFSSSPEKSVSKQVDARAVRDDQLRDLLSVEYSGNDGKVFFVIFQLGHVIGWI